ncbi:tRNA-specific 2-thiouridylase MnmA [Smittium mucronatum]|uniref:tRNA-5-taurinomethyluridine 2-sulfurtransferase n=1 Tax=Smittium mucronatum TaxID=133383 RepID=A0A1R0GM71_9FUNG|nr:tRNA-specific 2-thiouridylase MnmA [Smittium mucronatum]
MLLKQRGLKVVGVYMQNWDSFEETGTCTSDEDYKDVVGVCNRLKIDSIRVNLVKEYWARVFSVALDGYEKGYTPNPDILCNKEIKFGCLVDKLKALIPSPESHRTWFATGHYANVDRYVDNDGKIRTRLRRGKDGSKDQSYFLSGISQTQLEKIVFPLGDLYKKTEVRELARRNHLQTAKKAESFGICFVGEKKKFSNFLSEFIPTRKSGPEPLIKSALDYKTVIGRHSGMFSRTIGQSAGVTFNSEKWFVAYKDLDSNTMYAVPGHDHSLLYTQKVFLDSVHWIGSPPPTSSLATLSYQIRHLETPKTCSLVNEPNGEWAVLFHQPVYGATPGQYIVFYDSDVCLGNAPISRVQTGFRL